MVFQLVYKLQSNFPGFLAVLMENVLGRDWMSSETHKCVQRMHRQYVICNVKQFRRPESPATCYTCVRPPR